MSEKQPKSKLKRRKVSSEQIQPEMLKSRDPARETEPLAATAADVWWNVEQLPAVDNLWALILTSALQQPESQSWDLVPELPPPSAAKPASRPSDDLRWWDLSEEVLPLPPPPPPSSRACLLGPDTSDGPPATKIIQAFDQSEQQKCPEAGAEPSGGPEEERKEEDAQVNRPTSSRETGEDRRGAVGEKELQSCPMCLVPFPAGFTQMDCDGHLAQCLSEMNIDVTW